MDTASIKGGKASIAEETVHILCARAYAYDLLKCTFRQEPSRTFLSLLMDGKMIQAFPFCDEDTDIKQAIDTIQRYLNESDVTSEAGFQKLHWDYTRLFIGPGEVPAPPWESIYRDPERLHFSKETIGVRDAYLKYHLLPARFGHHPDDHIGLELDFMHQLSEMAKKQAESSDKKVLLEILQDQKTFLDDHLLKWVPAWSKDGEENAETGFYRAAAQLLHAYLKLDREMLEALIAAI